MFGVPGLVFGVECLGFLGWRIHGFEPHLSGFGFRVSGFGFQAHNLIK
jgi:hypothetical protein